VNVMTIASPAFNPADPQCWIGRGRPPEHAETLAAIWQAWPDLPARAPADARMARLKARVVAMKPFNDAIAAEVERKRRARNFAFMDDQAARGEIRDCDLAILRGRDRRGYDWDEAVRYAEGWYAAHSGWPYRPSLDARRQQVGLRSRLCRWRRQYVRPVRCGTAQQSRRFAPGQWRPRGREHACTAPASEHLA